MDAEDVYAASRDALGYLRPDLSQLDSVIDRSDDFTIDVTDVTEIDRSRPESLVLPGPRRCDAAPHLT